MGNQVIMNELKIKEIIIKDENNQLISLSKAHVYLQGILGDKHKDESLILLDDISYQEMIKHKEIALCMNKFYPHVVYQNIELKPFISINNLELKLKEKGKACHQKQGCSYFNQNHNCPLISKVYEYIILNEGDINIS